MLVNVLIYKVYLYDNNLIIIFNTQNKPYKEKIPLIEELEEKLGASSYKVRSAQPFSDNTNNIIYFIRWVCCKYEIVVLSKKET